MVEGIIDGLCHFDGSFFPMADRNKYLETKIFASGQDYRVNLEKINKYFH